ncbi:WD repeat-containing protein 91-like [Telopea speciosissima]|uniref:WD repeat-containing protein 91-like n=1 Tax=Telopea speciosissima TaxID=54955 RepID=UPI001CC3E312|nr:WD repeat-containing protein 91-like [Telopea speciosissima]XP_043697855.1 WD repeat-containing protein 91-like [Telopea speciosissima]
MENMQYAEELVREFLVFRGFTSTLQSLESELSTDIGKGFQVDKILELIFSVYVPKFQAERLVSLLNFFKQCFSSTDMVLFTTLSKLEVSILHYYIVHSIQSGRKDKLIEFLGTYGNDLLQSSQDWTPWFAIPYLKNPSLDPQFRVYFSREWFDALHLSFRNFLSEIFNGSRIPALLKTSTEKNTIKRLEKDIRQLNDKLSQLQALLEEKEVHLCLLKGMVSSTMERGRTQNDFSPHTVSETPVKGANKANSPSAGLDEHEDTFATEQLGETEAGVQDWDVTSPATLSSGLALSKQEHDASSTKLPVGDGGTEDDLQMFQGGLYTEKGGEVHIDEEFSEVKVEFQETFLGHTSPISRCRFSASGNNVASASVDGTVRIWTYDSSTSTSRNATICCGAEIMSLDWECKSDRLLLIGTADGGIKAWNVDAKRVVCDLNTTASYPRVLDLKCSPVEPIFVSVAASRGHGSSFIDQMGFASLTVWNMKTWKPMTVLPLGNDPPAITSVCFNHNGKILAASATDGMIHMFDMSAGLQITGWPAHDSALSSVLFGPDETSIFSLASDGKIFEWSLHNQGQILWSGDCSRFFNLESAEFCRHEMALDANGKRLLVTSNSVRSPIYQVQGHHTRGLRTLPHSAAITTVDWHPTLPIYLTGSADHSVRVTSIC